MDSLQKYTQNTNCISKDLRFRGNSDECIQELIEILYNIGGDDPTTNFNNFDFITIIKSILYDIKIFTPIDKKGNIIGKPRQELLPNGIYRKLLVYIIINNQQLQLDILLILFMALEENNVTGFMYIPLKGRAYKPISEVLTKYKVIQNIDWHKDYDDKLEKKLIICNSTIVSLIQSLLH
jgi:hypothetical protein